jgi:hypothetical protein
MQNMGRSERVKADRVHGKIPEGSVVPGIASIQFFEYESSTRAGGRGMGSHIVGVWASASQNRDGSVGPNRLRHHAPLDNPTIRFAPRPGVGLDRKLGGDL